jgi:competence protein ComEA
VFVLLAVLLLALGAVGMPAWPAAAPGPAVGPPRFRVDPNRDSAERLAVLPGLGPRRAAAIVADRAARGPFRDSGDLARVPGVGPGVIRKLAPYLPARWSCDEKKGDPRR